MYKKRTLLAIAGFLLLEAVLVIALPSRAPRAARGLTAGVNIVAAAALVLLARKKE